ncbi:hypothetical protein G0T05_003228 [Salmonella enterica subsp. enterica serovar Bredeney]|nr:hypothetical protein [Salmonella enterica subsp. enterica serovar Bredeney]
MREDGLTGPCFTFGHWGRSWPHDGLLARDWAWRYHWRISHWSWVVAFVPTPALSLLPTDTFL